MPCQTVVIIGATGSQGGAVAMELLSYPDSYHVRALTRDPSKPAAKNLAHFGAELYTADLDGGREMLASAFSGADIIYAMTDFWQTQSTDVEIAQGKAIADPAAQTSTVKHLIWSALPDPVKLSNGQFLNVHHWKGKSLVTEYMQNEQPALWAKTTNILFPNYFENCLTTPDRYLPVKDTSGTYRLTFPHSLQTVMPNAAIADTGKLVRAILEAGSRYLEKTVAFYSEALSEAEKLAIIGKRYNVPVQYQQVGSSEFQKILQSRDGLSEEIALDFTEQLMIFEKCGNVYANKDFVQANEIPGLKLQTWTEFLAKNQLRLDRDIAPGSYSVIRSFRDAIGASITAWPVLTMESPDKLGQGMTDKSRHIPVLHHFAWSRFSQASN
ncbi:hypothetical protein ASPWEDRAFT_68022 [Aspergillus wentii DTO 134E9]|uniref:NmrA-like domain-containing protein n=1 Tax=Aspergillus wentii DTO 134E9 TaxID=1073089 RepID=A0A1L9RSR6_ASPWE|nr:uncharacterized protein ASPWEDRAFT_68022 [Aspergillus wentii DTO 134E9]OJJ37888.1 hypothetical protein ASPWEDRAFT_68022 [Aspergillus wentii DTO 134E9]